jgi:MFS family permease
VDGQTRRVLGSHALASLAISLPWPLLVVLVWRHTHQELLVGATAAARMAPYVVMSWWIARVADRVRRDRLVRVTLGARCLLLLGVAAALAGDRLALAVILSTLAVAVATPAYPALAAGMPSLATSSSARATELLVTVEVASFVVGPALGGVLLARPGLIPPAAVVLSLGGWALYAGIRQPRPERAATRAHGPRPFDSPQPRGLLAAFAALTGVNAAVAAAGVTLLPLAEQQWEGSPVQQATAYGIATGALGFGALAAPLLGGAASAPGSRMRSGLLLVGAALAVAALAPSVGLAVLPLALAGAAAVRVEAAATRMLQERVRDDHRAGMLGVADSAMVTAALVGALAAPLLAAWWGPRVVLVLTAFACAGAPVVARRLRGIDGLAARA